jgi:hypothetical protein
MTKSRPIKDMEKSAPDFLLPHPEERTLARVSKDDFVAHGSPGDVWHRPERRASSP